MNMLDQKKEYRLRKNIFGRFILEVKEVRQHFRDLAGSGFYDESTEEVWRAANREEAKESGIQVI